MSEATLRESIIREFCLDDERVGDETVVQITRGSLRRLTAAAQAATPVVQPEAQVMESCFICGAALNDGKLLCHHPNVTPLAASFLMELEECDHFCCGMAPNECRAVKVQNLVTRECNAARLAEHAVIEDRINREGYVRFGEWKALRRAELERALAAAKEQPPMKRLPCGCLANNLSRCPVHDAP